MLSLDFIMPQEERGVSICSIFEKTDNTYFINAEKVSIISFLS